MRAKKRGGFSLIEVVIAMGISLIVLLAVGAVLAASHSRWNNTWGKVNLQQDASYVMLELSHAIKEASSATVENNGEEIQLFNTDGSWVKYIFKRNAKQLKYKTEGKAIRFWSMGMWKI